MSNENENVVNNGFGESEKDAIGEVMNITMGSAATAVSNMLNAKVWITTPTVSVEKVKQLVYPELEPSIRVKIKYIQGVSGENVLVLKQDDVQLILNQLMGMPLEVTDDFEFDEMNISAVCEVMNQMMGASATALAELINTPIDISTPEAKVCDLDEKSSSYGLDPEEEVCIIKFKLTIDNVINSEFISVLSIPLAKEIAEKMMAGFTNDSDESVSSSDNMSQDDIQRLLSGAGSDPVSAQPKAEASSGGTLTQDEINAMLSGAGSSPAAQPTPVMPNQPIMPQQAVTPQQAMPNQIPQPTAPMAASTQQNPYGYYQQAPYPYPQMPVQPMPMQPVPRGSAVNVQAVQLQSFDTYNNKNLNADQNDNLKLLMGVPLDVTVEIGSTRKKVKEILDFTQGTIIELERQAGAPVDIIVNGHLIARGDVVVIDDNFAVRITEIIKSKFLDNLGKE